MSDIEDIEIMPVVGINVETILFSKIIKKYQPGVILCEGKPRSMLTLY